MKTMTGTKKRVILAVIIALQCALILFWGSEKRNFFLDEYYSMGYAQALTDHAPHASYITQTDLWQENTS
ncbi:MAG: hypothetical protein IJM13_07945, partial [Lachnospiraceae bacterium]|nr:hypothetical protein [Lachnospiraceae bacterium]